MRLTTYPDYLRYVPPHPEFWQPNGGDVPGSVAEALTSLKELFPITVWKETAYTANHNEIVMADPSVIGAFTVTLPLIVAGRTSWIGIRRWSSGTNVLTIARSGSDNINLSGTTSIEYNVAGGGLLLINNGISPGTWYEFLKV